MSNDATKLLLVEDDKVIQQIYIYFLQKLNFQVDCVSSGEAAITSLKQNKYHALLLDLDLPDMSGEQILYNVRSQEKKTAQHLPIIVNTAHRDQKRLDQCRQQGADAGFSKPVNFDILQKMLVTLGAITNHSSITTQQ